jgi:hypothetical protein
MRLLKFLFIGIFVLNAGRAAACQCPVTDLSLQECAKYQVIFRGVVDSVKACGDRPGEAYFRILELYKGSIPDGFTVVFDCSSDCAAGFNPGEEWIIYTNHRQVTNGRMDWCSRSRKYIKNPKEDLYRENTGVDYFEEAEFLEKNLGLYRPLSSNKVSAENRNIRPDKTQTIVILFVSMAAILLFYWLFNKFFK